MPWSPIANLKGPQGDPGPDGGTTPHAARHAIGGSDPLTPASIGAQPAGSYQPLDSDLTAIAGLAPTNGQLLRRVAGAWAASTLTAADVGADPAGTAAALVAGRLAASANLSDVANAATARTNLGLGAAATRAVGTASTDVAAGNSGLPSGGAAGFVLSKNSATDFDDAWVPQAGRIVARGVKSSGNIASTGTEKPIMMIPVPVNAGRTYKVVARMEVDTTTADGFFTAILRTTFAAGTPADPTITSTLLDRALGLNSVASVPYTLEVVGFYDAASTGTLKVLLGVIRNSAAGQATIRTDGIAHRMWVEDQGPTVANNQTTYA